MWKHNLASLLIHEARNMREKIIDFLSWSLFVLILCASGSCFGFGITYMVINKLWYVPLIWVGTSVLVVFFGKLLKRFPNLNDSGDKHENE